jgi:hypothetical protein
LVTRVEYYLLASDFGEAPKRCGSKDLPSAAITIDGQEYTGEEIRRALNYGNQPLFSKMAREWSDPKVFSKEAGQNITLVDKSLLGDLLMGLEKSWSIETLEVNVYIEEWFLQRLEEEENWLAEYIIEVFLALFIRRPKLWVPLSLHVRNVIQYFKLWREEFMEGLRCDNEDTPDLHKGQRFEPLVMSYWTEVFGTSVISMH